MAALATVSVLIAAGGVAIFSINTTAVYAEPNLSVTELNCDRLPEFLEARWEATGLPSDLEGFVLLIEFSDGDREEVGGGGGGEPTIGDVGRTGGSFLTPAEGDTGPYTLILYRDDNLDTEPDESEPLATTTFTCEEEEEPPLPPLEERFKNMGECNRYVKANPDGDITRSDCKEAFTRGNNNNKN